MRKLFLAASAFVGAAIVPAVAHAGSVNIPVSVPHAPHVTTPNAHVVTPQALGTKLVYPDPAQGSVGAHQSGSNGNRNYLGSGAGDRIKHSDGNRNLGSGASDRLHIIKKLNSFSNPL